MTESEIIKALEYWIEFDEEINDLLKKYPSEEKMLLEQKKIVNTTIETLKFVNSQKAEIERLKKKNTILSKNADTAFQDGLNEAQDLYALQIKNYIKSEATKEFAERLKRQLNSNSPRGAYLINIVDTLIKEMAGE